MISTPRFWTNDPALYAEREAREELKLAHAERVERFYPIERPDLIDKKVHQLRQFAADLLRTKECYVARSIGDGNWMNVGRDTEQIRAFAKMAAEYIEPVIAAVLTAAEINERNAG